MGTEESHDAGESFGTKTGVGKGVGFGTENNLKNSRENNIDTRFVNGTNVRLQTVSYRDGIGRLGTWREKRNDDRESHCTKTSVSTGVGFAIKSNCKNSMKKIKETREGIGTMAGICAMVGIGKGKGMNCGNALQLNASKGTWTRPDYGTGASTDLDTNANSASATDCRSGKNAGRETGGKGPGWDSRCFGQQVSQQSLIARRQQFHRSETQEAKTATTKLTTHDNGNIVKFNQGNDDNSEELHQLPKPEKFSALEVKEARTTLYSLVQQHHLAEFQLIRQGKRIPRNSNLLSLSPFFDNESNVIRVGVRLANSPYDINKKFPVLIPRKSPINKLLIREA